MLIATTMSTEPTFWMIRNLMPRAWTLTDLIGSHKLASTSKRLTRIATSPTYTRWEILSRHQAERVRWTDLQSSPLIRKAARATTPTGLIPWTSKSSKLIYSRSKLMTRFHSSSAQVCSFRRSIKYSSFSSRMTRMLQITRISISRRILRWSMRVNQTALHFIDQAKIWKEIGLLASEDKLQACSYQKTGGTNSDTWWMVQRHLKMTTLRLMSILKCRLYPSARLEVMTIISRLPS